MRNSSWCAWGLPMALVGCLNNNVTVTGTISGSAEEMTATEGAETDSESGTESSSTTESTETSTSDTSTSDTSTSDTSTSDTSTSGTSTTGTSTTTEGTTTDDTGETSMGETTEGEMACGDGDLDVGEGCDDGNLDAGDGCDASCAVEAPKYAVLAQRPPFSTRFYLYNVQAGWTEQWVTLPANLGTILLTPAVSADHVYILAEDTNMVWKYSLDAGTWSMHVPGPAALPNTAGFMEWVGDGLCLAYWTVKELHCHDGVEWRKIPLTISPGLGASWDPATNQLYVKAYTQLGFQVVDLDSDELVRTVADTFLATEVSFAAHGAGKFYQADATKIYAVPDHGGAFVDTGYLTPGNDIAGDFHPTDGKLYMISDVWNTNKHALLRYDPMTGMTTDISVPTWSAFVNMQPTLRFQRPKYE
ncbi:hypothetical protein [Nannocystis radixulma]|uniref:Myxococcus cysteine-rich repeat-containing protein n=1 Tax=Nannocystis radixulma TaxID=2995305 RepID=A0ABT5BEH0_9BACT|nr:hypothetical protein [Nannocystis radixulma]MDC0671995.1 hypothetical protein [Nannocystis radixulma]